MIISNRKNASRFDFEDLLEKSYSIIINEASLNPKYFIQRSAIEFEKDLRDCFITAAKGTDFDGTIHLISGHMFPDILIDDFYGVEVKTTQKEHWKSTGNSVLETTRIESVEKIYLFFARLNNPLGFKYRLYQECLYEIAVTHSPRYLIDMELEEGKSIFDKIGIEYDDLRKRENPIKPIVDYYRSIAKPGQEPWWMDADKGQEITTSPVISLWNNLPTSEQLKLRNMAMARFPEIFGKSSSKYQRLTTWLASRHSIVDSSMRDRFSAGGKVNIDISGLRFKELPRVFLHLSNHFVDILEEVKNIPEDEISYYWKLKEPLTQNQKKAKWIERLFYYSKQQCIEAGRLIKVLLET